MEIGVGHKKYNNNLWNQIMVGTKSAIKFEVCQLHLVYTSKTNQPMRISKGLRKSQDIRAYLVRKHI